MYIRSQIISAFSIVIYLSNQDYSDSVHHRHVFLRVLRHEQLLRKQFHPPATSQLLRNLKALFAAFTSLGFPESSA